MQPALGPRSTHARRTQGHHPPGRRRGVHRDRPAGRARATSPRARVNVSSATVRNDMAVLEQEGYLAQPHTSAGRVPPTRATGSSSTRSTRRRLGRRATPSRSASFFAKRPRRARADAARHQPPAGRASPTTRRSWSARRTRRPPSARCSSSGCGRASRWSWSCCRNGVVEKHTLDLDRRRRRERARRRRRPASPATCSAGTARDVGRVLDRPATRSRRRRAPRVRAGRSRSRSADRRRPGLRRRHSRMAARVRRRRDRAARCCTILEQQYVVVALLRDVLDRGLTSRSAPRPASSRWPTARWSSRPTWSTASRPARIGVLGPTRMNYPQALAAVAVVSQRLGRRLSEG